MKRFTATWTMAVASAVLLAAPTSGAAQTPQTSTPTTSSPQQSAATDPQASAQEHLRKASAALDEIKTAALPAKAKNDVAEIKRRITALERTAAGTAKASTTGQANKSANAKSGATWGSEVAAIDKSLSTLLGPDSTAPAATGTSGTTTPATGNKAAAAVTLDAETRAALTQVRTHLTAFATAMAGGKTDTEPAATTSSPTSSSSTASSSSTSSTSGASGASATTPPSAQTTQPSTPAEPAAPTSASGAQVDQEAARQHLTAARNTLSALTQLPAASQLAGESRTQVAQLISSFNELISTQSQWRDSYAKVNANLTALLGPDPVASDPTNASGTAGAVGTSGGAAPAAATIDPAVREKLVELRRHLTAFEKSAGGGSAASTGGAGTGTAGTTDPAASTTANPPATTTPEQKPTPTQPAATQPATTQPAATQPTQTTGTSGSATTTQGTATGNADVMKHVAAIEALLKMQDDSGGLTLTKAQVEQLRTHWAALRSAIEKK